MRLMQGKVRVARNRQLVRLYNLLQRTTPAHGTEAARAAVAAGLPLEPRAAPVPGLAARVPSVSYLERAAGLPFEAYAHIVAYMPLPRLWEASVARLRRRSHIDADATVRGGMALMNEILTDACLAKCRDQSLHLVRLAHDPAASAWLASKRDGGGNMPELLLKWLKKWSDVQSIVGRLERGVSMDASIAAEVVTGADATLAWYRKREGGLLKDSKTRRPSVAARGDGDGGAAADDEGDDDGESDYDEYLAPLMAAAVVPQPAEEGGGLASDSESESD